MPQSHPLTHTHSPVYTSALPMSLISVQFVVLVHTLQMSAEKPSPTHQACKGNKVQVKDAQPESCQVRWRS